MSTGIALSPAARATALEQMARRRARRARHRRRRGRRRARRWTPPPAACGRPRRGARLGQRHVEPLQQADPRRPALPGDARLRAGPRGAARARAAAPDRLAPHLVRPVPFLYPLQHRVWERPYVGAGVAALRHDGAASGPRRGACRTTGTSPGAGALRVAPSLRKDVARRGAAVLRRPGRRRPAHDDARAHRGRLRRARAPTAPGCIGFLREGERVTGARVRDLETGASFDGPRQAGRSTPPACGPTTPRRMAGERGQFHVRASKGIHLVVPRDRIQSATGLILRTEKSRAVRHPVGPALDHRHHRHRLDARQGAPGGEPRRTSTTCSTTSTRCSRTPLTRDDVEGVYAGLRPLLSGESESTSKLSREHVVAHPVPGLVVVAGGKYTTYRVMAKDAVDEAVARPGRDRRARLGAPTRIPLVGAEGYAGAVEPARPARRRVRAARGADRAPAAAATARSSTSCWP